MNFAAKSATALITKKNSQNQLTGLVRRIGRITKKGSTCTSVSSGGIGVTFVREKGRRSTTASFSLCAGSSLSLPAMNPWDSGKSENADQLISVVFAEIRAHITAILGSRIIQ